jgi:glycosyltransferase involved in cell wall biosynthesis
MSHEPDPDPTSALRMPVAGERRTFRQWIVLRAGRDRRWGGEIRRQMIFERLADRTAALVVESWPYVQGYTRDRFWPSMLPPRRRPCLAVTEQPPESVIPWIVRRTDPVVVAIYDDPVAQTRALGIRLDPDQALELGRLRRLAMATFRWHVVPTASFAELAGLDPDRVIVGGNGTMTDEVRPGPWPTLPSIGFVSGAAPGRGIEPLVEACRLVRSSWPDLRLYLWLVATSPSANEYLDELRTRVRGEPWITIGAVPHAGLGEALARATILCIPHPANEYMDVALPVKLLDSMAAGRPLVVTPRRETAAIVERYGAGLVTGGDEPADLAVAFERLLGDEVLAQRLGAAGREAALQEFDWKVVGDRIATEILAREGRRGRRWR